MLRSNPFSASQTAILVTGGMNCQTPTYRVGDSHVTVLQVAPMAGGGWALHMIVRSSAPLTQQRQFADGSGSAPRYTSLSILGTGSVGNISAQPGAKMGETYLGVPAFAGSQVRVQLSDTRSETVGSFDLPLSSLNKC